MKRSLSTLVLIAAAGTVTAFAASAQTNPTTPQVGGATLDGRITDEAGARRVLKSQGYSSVGSLRMGADGSWSGSAMMGNQQTAVTVDANGNVTSH